MHKHALRRLFNASQPLHRRVSRACQDQQPSVGYFNRSIAAFCSRDPAYCPSMGTLAAATVCVAQKLQRQQVPVQCAPSVDDPFTVLSFNVLADGLAQDGDFVHAPEEVLQWSYRLPLIVQELLEADADIICLQEVNHYDDVAAVLEPLGYQGFFYPKPQSPCLVLGAPADGTAVFYRAARFTTVQPPQGLPFTAPSGGVCSQGFVLLLLADQLSQGQVLVASTHLKAKSGTEHEQLRLQQVQQLLQQMQQVVAEADSRADSTPATAAAAAAGHATRSTAVVLCGDFNTEPDSITCQAVKQCAALQLQPLWEQPLLSTKRSEGHGPAGGSNGSGSSSTEPEWSTWKVRSGGEVRRIIDYVWYSQQTLAQLGRWAPLRLADVGPAALPCAGYPSDHLAICCRLGWVQLGRDVSAQ